MKVNHRLTSFAKRQRRVRANVRGTAQRPRLSVSRSNRFVYLQVINDEVGKTLVAAGMGDKKAVSSAKGTKTEKAQTVTKKLAEKLKKAGITQVVFDRGGYRYHGRVRAIAEGLRQEGIEL